MRLFILLFLSIPLQAKEAEITKNIKKKFFCEEISEYVMEKRKENKAKCVKQVRADRIAYEKFLKEKKITAEEKRKFVGNVYFHESICDNAVFYGFHKSEVELINTCELILDRAY